jgi:hypothetical protein
MKMEALLSFETMVSMRPVTQRQISGYMSVTKANRIMLVRGIPAVCCDGHVIHRGQV